MNSFETLTVAERIALTLDGLCRAIAARIDPRGVGGPLPAAMIVLIWTRVRRVEGRIQGLLARFRAGRLRVATRGVRRGGASVSPAPGLPQDPTAKLPRYPTAKLPRYPTAKLPRYPTAKLPRRFGWLLPLVPCEAANRASQFRAVLELAEMQALLAASPQAMRVLAPLFRMLGIEKPVVLPVVTAPAAEVVVERVIAAPVAGLVAGFGEFPAPSVRVACRGSPFG